MSSSAILEHLAGRVRARRKDLSLTLRELGEQSGVSERFLVLLEGGRANVSVTRLEDIARVLGTTASEILSDRPLAAASSAPSHEPAHGGPRLVALLGLRGAGKTTIGAAAAKRLGLPFIELDERVAERAGMSLAQIFELHGMAYYRRLEREALDRLIASGERGIVATGGGIVADHATFEALQRAAVTVWLKAKPQDHWSRVVAQGDARPMENRSGAMNELRGLLRARRALYERATHVVDTSTLGLSRAVDKVVKIAREAANGAHAA
ncbi:Regulatory protein of benzoate catabolism [Minicystis rosea]|nr:Regulatory protein of benzoate catabolism [Minicystis rosea]